MSAGEESKKLLEAIEKYGERTECKQLIGVKSEAPEWARELLLDEIERQKRGEYV